MDIKELLQRAIDSHATDVHISSGAVPLIRVFGDLQPIAPRVFDHEEVLAMICSLMSSAKMLREQAADLDFALELNPLGRFRVNVTHHLNGISAAIRIIPSKMLSLRALCAPFVIQHMIEHLSGLMIIIGPTGCGKSTLLSAMVDHINTTSRAHIIMLEDPIERIHHNKQGMIHQRQLHKHTLDWGSALKSILRSDPDVVVIGEIRDLASLRIACSAAHTGHLVLSTLHSFSASQSISRMIDLCPEDEKISMRLMLADTLQAIVATKLEKNQPNQYSAVFDVMQCTDAIRHLIRENKVNQITTYTGRAGNAFATP